MDATGIITGAVVALVAGTLIPFLTTEFSLRSKRRRQIIRARREALDTYVQIRRRVQMEALAEQRSGGPMYEIAVGNSPERQAAHARLEAQFSLRDKPVYDLWAASDQPPGAQLVISSWANGENLRARRAAKRLIEIRERQEEDLD